MKQIATEIIKIEDKKLKKETARKKISPYYFIDRALQVEFNITLDGHHINHASSKLTINPNYSQIEIRYVKEMLEEMTTVYAKF